MMSAAAAHRSPDPHLIELDEAAETLCKFWFHSVDKEFYDCECVTEKQD